MKLLMESWRKFVSEQQIQEASDEEISYLEDALEIDPKDLPFGNIFGDRYRFIEELKVIDPNSPFKVTMNALESMGWNVGEPSDIKFDSKNRISGKILCTKTKVTNYIDKQGKVQTVKRAVKLNLPKLLTGITNFIENSWAALRKEHFEVISELVKNMNTEPQQGQTYSLPKAVWGKPVSKKDYMRLMKYVNAANYWIGLTPSDKTWAHSDGLIQLEKEKRFDFDKFKQFSLFLSEKFQNFLKNVNKLYDNYYLIYSRHPVDVFRMSDHKELDSCHSLPSGKGDVTWDKYNICALSEVYGNGMIVYTVKGEEFEKKGVIPSNTALSDLDDVEIFADERRGLDGIVPSSRVRIRHASYHGLDEPIRLAVAEKRVYGVELPGFKDKVNNRLSVSQKEQISKIADSGDIIDLSDFTRYGGDYEDNSVSELIPHLFRKAGTKTNFTGNVNYDWDLQSSLSQKVGRSELAMVNARLNEIFTEFEGLNNMLSFSHDVTEGAYGVEYDWSMFVKFRVNFEADEMPYELYEKATSNIKNTVDYEFTQYYEFPESSDVSVTWDKDKKQFIVIIEYSGDDLASYDSLGDLEENLNFALIQEPRYSYLFDYYHTNGPIQLIENKLVASGLIKSDQYSIEPLIDQYELDSNNSWWPLEDVEKDYDDFNNEIIIGASFQEPFGIFPNELIEEVPDQLKPAAIKIMAQFLNQISKNWKSATEFVFEQEYNDNLPPITIMNIEFDRKVISPEDMAEIVEEENEMEFTISTGMTNTMSYEKLENIAKFLVDDASVDEIVERLENKIKSLIADTLKAQLSENKRRIKVKIIR
tara:strand:- start:921 stop:3365 length:2445 start_codon:yes stop_codon:yes gene_type:complete